MFNGYCVSTAKFMYIIYVQSMQQQELMSGEARAPSSGEKND